jgi:hypothetical protein
MGDRLKIIVTNKISFMNWPVLNMSFTIFTLKVMAYILYYAGLTF